jgi:hypothetical protein
VGRGDGEREEGPLVDVSTILPNLSLDCLSSTTSYSCSYFDILTSVVVVLDKHFRLIVSCVDNVH